MSAGGGGGGGGQGAPFPRSLPFGRGSLGRLPYKGPFSLTPLFQGGGGAVGIAHRLPFSAISDAKTSKKLDRNSSHRLLQNVLVA